MSNSHQILLYILEHLGVPLMGALPAVQKKSAKPDEDAEKMAKVLTSAVELGMALSMKMNMPSDAAKAEALRFKLTALSAHALSARMQGRAKDVTGSDVESVKVMSESLLSFAKHFTLDEASLKYFETLGLENIMAAEFSQMAALESLLPLVMILNDGDQKKLSEIAEKLHAESVALSEKVKQEGVPPQLLQQKIFALLAQTFISAYTTGTQNEHNLGQIWTEFDRQKALILVLVDYLYTGSKQIETIEATPDAGVSSATPPASETQAAAQKEEAMPVPAQPADDAASRPEKPAIFGAKPQSSVPVDSSLPSPPPVSSPAKESENSQGEDQGEEGAKSGGGGSPLSFFKKPN